MSVSGDGRCTWYRSIQSVPSRRRLASHSRMIHRRLLPWWLGSSPIVPWNLVARTTSSRRPASALPTISSLSPAEYTSAVSMKLMPPSRARWMIEIDSSWSRLPHAPNIIAPRQRGLTLTPVRPRVRIFMAPEPNVRCHGTGDEACAVDSRDDRRPHPDHRRRLPRHRAGRPVVVAHAEEVGRHRPEGAARAVARRGLLVHRRRAGVDRVGAGGGRVARAPAVAPAHEGRGPPVALRPARAGQGARRARRGGAGAVPEHPRVLDQHAADRR